MSDSRYALAFVVADGGQQRAGGHKQHPVPLAPHQLRQNVGTQRYRGAPTAASAGIAAALVFGYLGALVFKPKMKE